MNPNRFFMPNMAMINPMMRNVYMAPRNMGLFSRITNGIRSFNWSGLLNGANRTLNVVNQTIPLIRQARPMFNNMRNMLQIAKAFKKETANQSNIQRNNIRTSDKNISVSSNKREQKKEVNYDNYPNFFI